MTFNTQPNVSVNEALAGAQAMVTEEGKRQLKSEEIRVCGGKYAKIGGPIGALGGAAALCAVSGVPGLNVAGGVALVSAISLGYGVGSALGYGTGAVVGVVRAKASIQTLENMIRQFETMRRQEQRQQNGAPEATSQPRATAETPHQLEGLEEWMKCSIRHTIMRDPVVLSSGISYERAAIVDWYNSTHDINGNFRCPLTDLLVHGNPQLLPRNQQLYALIQEFLARNPHLAEEENFPTFPRANSSSNSSVSSTRTATTTPPATSSVSTNNQGTSNTSQLGENNCGYEAIGLTRAIAHQRLSENIVSIRDLLRPVVQETLLTQNFINHLRDHQQLSEGLRRAFDNYRQAAGASSQSATTNLQVFAEDLVAVQGYLDYDVRDRRIDHGCAHPCVLQALANVLRSDLYIWQDRIDGTPNVNFPRYNHPRAEQRIDILYANGHFARLGIRPLAEISAQSSTQSTLRQRQTPPSVSGSSFSSSGIFSQPPSTAATTISASTQVNQNLPCSN
ncbi:MAG: U-box domain-containing protein [Gammaproteobacteria bacterium]